MKKKFITLLLLCSLIIPVEMTGCLFDDDDVSVQEPTEAVTQEVTEVQPETVQEETPAQEETEVPVQDETETSAQNETEAAVQETTEAAAQETTETTTQEATETPTEEATEEATEEDTEEAAEAVTEVATEAGTEPVDMAQFRNGTPWLCSLLDGVVTEDTPVNLRDDFYLYVNKDAHVATVLSEEHPSGGFYPTLGKYDYEGLSKMFNGSEPQEHDQKLAYDLYHLASDWETRNKIGTAPLKRKTDRVEAISSIEEMTAYFDASDVRFWGSYYDQDYEDDSRYCFVFSPLSLLLGDSALYAEISPESQEMIAYYGEFFEKMLVKTGYTEEEAHQKYENYLAFEKLLAPYIPTQEEMRNPEQYLQHVSRDELKEIVGNVPVLAPIEQQSGFPEMDSYYIWCPEYFKQLNVLYTEENLELMKDYIIIRTIPEFATLLDKESCELYYSIVEPDQNGHSGMKPDEQYAIDCVDQWLTWAVSKYYTETYLKQEDKDRISQFVKKVRATYCEMLENEDFISEETRAKAIEKLNALNTFILFPDEDEWAKHSYAALDFKSAEEGGTYFDAMESILLYYNDINREAFLNSDMIGNDEWMTEAKPYELNCFNIPSTNSIYILGAFIKESTYHSDMSDAELYGTIGAVIGHEITHAFDITGAMYDKMGDYNNWWTEEDYAAFMERNAKLIAYYDNKIQPWEGLQFNGIQLAGEACADMGGIKCMLRMAEEIPDFDYDVFFRSFAKFWMSERMLDEVLYRNATNPHPMEYLRVNVTLQQFDEFLNFYGITEDDGMYLAPEDRILIW